MMEALCQELGVPRKQIRDTIKSDRFIVIVHKSWLKCLIEHKRVAKFPVHPGFQEWPINEDGLGSGWKLTYITVYKKFTHKVIPLANCRKENSDNETILSFSQMMQLISQSNHRNLWKSAFKKFAGQRSKVPTKESINKSERNAVNLIPYDNVLLEAILRTYGCHVVNGKSEKGKQSEEVRSERKRLIDSYSRFEAHVNLYPVTGVVETNGHFMVIYNSFIENTLFDCVSYSPAILDKSYNKPLFVIYQLMQLTRTLHDRGLILGNISLNDIFVTDNLWLNVMPQLDENILQSIEHLNDAPADEFATRKNSWNMTKYNPMINHLSYSLKDYCEMWCNGQLSNFDYLTILNNLSGRKIGHPGYHHIMPWVTDFISRNGMNWRDLTKSKYRLNKGDVQLDLMFTPSTAANMTPHHVSDVLSEITYYVYMARRTSKDVLCKHVRPIWVPAEYPASITRLQEWTPDECISEFFTDPLVFKSIHEDLPNLEVPTWSSCPEDFITKHREALESQYVSERLHHWIDLNFGYKLTGNAAIKAKNVYLSLVDDHQSLCKHGIVQLFTESHPPKQYQTVWTSKTPPRIYSNIEARRRITRSTEDLSHRYLQESDSFHTLDTSMAVSPSRSSPQSSSTRTHSPNTSDEATAAMLERSTSLHSNVQRTPNQIILPKDYNPIAGLSAVENMEVFLSKTFCYNKANENLPYNTIGHELSRAGTGAEDNANGFTNRIFSERFQENLMKDTKRLHNLNQKNLFVQNSTRNFKQIIADHRMRELQIIGCIIVELFLTRKLCPLGSGAPQTLNERIAATQSVLKADFNALPKVVQYPVKLLFSYSSDNNSPVVTDAGLPKPSAHQILQPFLTNFLFPFPLAYHKLYTLLRSLSQYDAANKLLDIYTHFDCDGSNCTRFESLDKTRIAYNRKIAECKVNACVVQLDGLLTPIGYDQFPIIDLLLPHIIDLLNSEETSILAAWYLFDVVATVLGPEITRKRLLEPILRLYDAESDERINFLNSNFDSSMKFTTNSAFKSSKTIKLYHHSFLLRLIVRFGLKCFLDNFVSPLIEAIGGYKEPMPSSAYHYHDNRNSQFKKSRSAKNLKMCDDVTNNSVTVNVPEESIKSIQEEGLFAFDGDDANKPAISVNLSDSTDDTEAINKIIDQFDITMTRGESILDLRMNHSAAEEATEDAGLIEAPFKTGNFSGLSFDENQFAAQSSSSAIEDNSFVPNGPMSPTIPIPTSTANRPKFDTIDCEIGSKKSIDCNEFLTSSFSQRTDDDASLRNSSNTRNEYLDARAQQQQHKISEMSGESLLWLSHRLGPVLTARYLTRNLLKMLTLCYVGQENLLPDYGFNQNEEASQTDNLIQFSIADARIVGDRNAIKVLECLTSITALFGDQFILLQYFPHITELIVLCKKRITSSLEGGLISSVQFLKFLVPCLSDSIIMDQLHDVILKSIIHPIIRLLGSTQCLMPSGFLARSILARKLLDVIYVLAVRIGPEMTKEHLCVPALQRFFLIFDKAYGISDHLHEQNEHARNDHSPSPEDSHFIEIRRDGGIKEWSIKGSPIQIVSAKTKADGSPENITPPKQGAENSGQILSLSDKALEEIKDVFTPHLAHVAYVPFLKYLGDHIMKQFVKNLLLILNLCHEYEQPDYASGTYDNRKCDFSLNGSIFERDENLDTSLTSNTFGTPVIGNRIEVRKESVKSEIGPMELLDLVTHKFEQLSSPRHLRGNWLAYWEHEIGRPEKNNHFNLKQIKLQTFAGHTNSVRSLLCMDNENSFISASKDKTVKLWSLRSEGDGSKISSCQFTYVNHRKSVHSLAFLESLRLAVSCDSGIHIWDPFVGGEIGQLDSHKLTPVSIVKTYPAPSALILAGTAESTVKIIDARTCSYVNEWKFASNSSGSVRCMAIAPSGNWIAVALSSGQMMLCDGRTGIIRASWRATDGELLQLIAINEHQVVSSSLDHSICVWSTIDGSLLHQMKNPNEPSHCLLSHQSELIFGTPANRIGVYSSVSADSSYSITKLRSETFKGVLTSLALLPLNRMLLVGGDSGNISLLC